jgi:outer membrane receptor for ferrienterochelin and colicins
MRKIYISLLAMIAAGAASAQLVPPLREEDTAKAKELSEVVVTGQYKPQSIKNSVYQVRVITKERIQKQGATKLQDVLNNELNIRFSQDLATGGSDISMLGLSGQNVKILIDGLPMIGRQGTSNEININQVDVNTIERIEIVEGPMSVIYGADALAGVINIITKKAGASKLSVSARVQEETVGKEYDWKTKGIHTQSVSIAFRHKGWEAGGGFGYYYFGGWRGDSTRRELTQHWKDQITANGFVGYSAGKFNIRYRIDGLDEIITNPGNFTQKQIESGDSLAYDQEYLSNRVMQQLQAGYFVNSNLSFQAQASYSDYSRQVFSSVLSKNTGKLSLSPASGSQSTVDFNGLTARATALYKISPVFSLQPGIDINIENGKGERLASGTNRVEDYAFFITSEITPKNNKINIRPGLRFIKNSVYDAPPVIPSINTKFVLTKDIDLRLAYARGFRSPSLRELYFNFFDANHQIIGNPDLKAETSNSFTGSLAWRTITDQKAAFTATLSGFYNDVKNLIDFAISPSDPNVFNYQNIENYKSRGVNLAGTFNYKNWNASSGFGYTGRYNQFTEEDKSLPEFKWSAEVNSAIGYNFPKIGFNVNLFYKFTGKLPYYQLTTVNNQDVIVLAETEGYHWADLTLNKKFFKYLTINAGIKNLFDVDFINSMASGGTHSSVGGTRSIGYGRSYFAGLVFNWDKK